MKKFFKVMGIGAAIGTLAYGVIKYKHDQQFKEKVDNTAETVKNKADQVRTKADAFAVKHPVLTTVGFATAVFVPIIAVRAALRPSIEHYQDIMQSVAEGQEYDDEAYEKISQYTKTMAVKQKMFDDIMANPENYVIVPKEKYEEHAIKKPADYFSNWDEKYRKNWNAVNKFAQDLILEDGESYLLEDAKQYNVPCDHAMISHLIDGTGCYPPECKNDIII
jgi:hypothetical protein